MFNTPVLPQNTDTTSLLYASERKQTVAWSPAALDLQREVCPSKSFTHGAPPQPTGHIKRGRDLKFPMPSRFTGLTDPVTLFSFLLQYQSSSFEAVTKNVTFSGNFHHVPIRHWLKLHLLGYCVQRYIILVYTVLLQYLGISMQQHGTWNHVSTHREKRSRFPGASLLRVTKCSYRWRHEAVRDEPLIAHKLGAEGGTLDTWGHIRDSGAVLRSADG